MWYLGIEPTQSSCMLGKHSASRPNSQPVGDAEPIRASGSLAAGDKKQQQKTPPLDVKFSKDTCVFAFAIHYKLTLKICSHWKNWVSDVWCDRSPASEKRDI